MFLNSMMTDRNRIRGDEGKRVDASIMLGKTSKADTLTYTNNAYVVPASHLTTEGPVRSDVDTDVLYGATLRRVV